MSSSAPLEASPSVVPSMPDSNGESKTCSFKLASEGMLGFYVYSKDKDELLSLFNERVDELNNSLISRCSGRDGCFKVKNHDNEILGHLERGEIPVWLGVSVSDNSIQSWSELFCGRTKHKLTSRNQCNCNKYECWDRSQCRYHSHLTKDKHCCSKAKISSMFDSCPYHRCHPGHYFQPALCCDPYYDHPSSFCYQDPFPSFYPNYRFVGNEWNCLDYRSKRCPFRY